MVYKIKKRKSDSSYGKAFNPVEIKLIGHILRHESLLKAIIIEGFVEGYIGRERPRTRIKEATRTL